MLERKDLYYPLKIAKANTWKHQTTSNMQRKGHLTPSSPSICPCVLPWAPSNPRGHPRPHPTYLPRRAILYLTVAVCKSGSAEKNENEHLPVLLAPQKKQWKNLVLAKFQNPNWTYLCHRRSAVKNQLELGSA